MDDTAAQIPSIRLPDAPVLVAGLTQSVIVSPDGEVSDIANGQIRSALGAALPLLCHTPATCRRTGLEWFPTYDILELYAFVRPARFCVPTPKGLCAATGQGAPESLEDQAIGLIRAVSLLLKELAALPEAEQRRLAAVARPMARANWCWGPSVLAALAAEYEARTQLAPFEGYKVWKNLGEWPEHAPETPPGSQPVDPGETRRRLASLLGDESEDRPQQADYASAATAAFQPREAKGLPHFVLAEAGTGVGKTLGYVAPASLWAEKNQAPVWISTYTRNLQRQIDTEMDRLFPDAAEKRSRVVVRKGRENYLCLLNLDDAVRGLQTQPHQAIPLGLMARFTAATRDGDLVGGDFPSWLTELLGDRFTTSLADQRGECIYSACGHYQKCFIEKAVRRARQADLVVANHALVMVQAALGGLDDNMMPQRYVFDEGHHLFDAADKAFAAHLSGMEGEELRRWLRGAEAGRVSRARGLKRRLEEVLAGRENLAEYLAQGLRASLILPATGWRKRLEEGAPSGAMEQFLLAVRAQVLARAAGEDRGYSLECEAKPALDAVLAQAAELDRGLARIEQPLRDLRKALAALLDQDADELETADRQRIEGAVRSLQRRALAQLGAWRDMLGSLVSETPMEFVDWFELARSQGREIDVGMCRHWVDPTLPMVQSLSPTAHGILVTSATLRDGTGDADHDWAVAEDRSGAAHLPMPAIRAGLKSPYDYANHTKILIIQDVDRNQMDQIAAAYRELFLAARGGALGLFTAITRLKAVHQRLSGPLEQAGLPLFGQHVDHMDVSTLIDIFRAERDACLLGTDAVRDGVDVPGESLRLIVFDRVPWPRPDILHKARKSAFLGRAL